MRIKGYHLGLALMSATALVAATDLFDTSKPIGSVIEDESLISAYSPGLNFRSTTRGLETAMYFDESTYLVDGEIDGVQFKVYRFVGPHLEGRPIVAMNDAILAQARIHKPQVFYCYHNDRRVEYSLIVPQESNLDDNTREILRLRFCPQGGTPL